MPTTMKEIKDYLKDYASDAAETLELVKDSVEGVLGELPPPDVADLYHVVNPLETDAKKIREAVRTRLEGLRESEFTEIENGNFVLKTPAGTTLEFRPRVKAALNPAKAEALLKGKGLFSLAVDTTVTIKDPIVLHQVLEAIVYELRAGGHADLADNLEDTVENVVQHTYSINESKIETLLGEGELDVDDIEAMFDKRTTYALYDTTK